MARKSSTPRKPNRKTDTDSEWIGGIFSIPSWVVEDGQEPYRPNILLWMNANELIFGSTVGKPGELLSQASQHLKLTMEKPMIGPPHKPARLRVATVELANVLRARHPEIQVECAPTPEIDKISGVMKANLESEDEETLSYLSSGVEPEAMASFFRATAAFFRAQPWLMVPSNALFSITIKELHVKEALLAVIGQMKKNFGYVLFSSLKDYKLYANTKQGIVTEFPPHFVLNFVPKEELTPELHNEISHNKWEIADPKAYPSMVSVDSDLIGRPPSSIEIKVTEAITLAVTHILAEKKALQAVWKSETQMTRTFSLQTHYGEFEVELKTSIFQMPKAFDPSDNILAKLANLSPQGQEEIDFDTRHKLEDELLNQFSASPEAKVLTDIFAVPLIMDLAANYFGQTIATLSPETLREVLFQIFPRKVTIEASAAEAIIKEHQAFYRFLKRSYGFKDADALLKVLGGSATKNLKASLSDTSQFGLAKSLMMQGASSGSPMDSAENIEAWMKKLQNMPLPPSFKIPIMDGPPTTPKPPTATKKNKPKKKLSNQTTHHRTGNLKLHPNGSPKK
jgi:hypothetical protein